MSLQICKYLTKFKVLVNLKRKITVPFCRGSHPPRAGVLLGVLRGWPSR